MPVPAGYLSGSTAAAFGSSASLIPPPPINTQQPGVVTSLLYSGSKFRGYQKSKGNSYDVEVVLQVGAWGGYLTVWPAADVSDERWDDWQLGDEWARACCQHSAGPAVLGTFTNSPFILCRTRCWYGHLFSFADVAGSFVLPSWLWWLMESDHARNTFLSSCCHMQVDCWQNPWGLHLNVCWFLSARYNGGFLLVWLPEDKRTDGGENLILIRQKGRQFKMVLTIELPKVRW